MHWELIHAEEKDGFMIRFYVAPETQDPVGAFDDDGETAAAIREGRFEWFIAKVTASRNDIELADDYLGGCCYESVRDFVRDDDYYADMRNQVIAEARAAIKKLTEAA
jgi:hypothetical protein